MGGDALWYEAAMVVGITNALNVVADGLGAADGAGEAGAGARRGRRRVYDDIRAFYGGAAEIPIAVRPGRAGSRLPRPTCGRPPSAPSRTTS